MTPTTRIHHTGNNFGNNFGNISGKTATITRAIESREIQAQPEPATVSRHMPRARGKKSATIPATPPPPLATHSAARPLPSRLGHSANISRPSIGTPLARSQSTQADFVAPTGASRRSLTARLYLQISARYAVPYEKSPPSHLAFDVALCVC